MIKSTTLFNLLVVIILSSLSLTSEAKVVVQNKTAFVRTKYKCDPKCQTKAKTLKDNFDCLNQCEQYYQTSFSSCKDEHSVPLKMDEIKRIANKIVNCDPN